MPLTPHTLTRHELVGLHVEVVDAACESRVGLAGRVRSESERTLVLATDGGVRRVPKRDAAFRVALTDEAAGRASGDRRRRKPPGSVSELPSETATSSGQSGGCEGVVYVTVDGEQLLSRPAQRSERGVDSQWR